MNKKPWFCQDCLIKMEWDNFGFYKCQQCGTEVWQKEVDRDKEARQVAESLDDVIIPVKKRGGGSNGKSSRKQQMKKKTTKQIYEDMIR